MLNKIFGQHDEKTIAQMEKVAANGGIAVLSADAHVGMAFPVGGIWAHPDLISIHGVGVDIGCGNTAIKLDIKSEDVQNDISNIMDDIVNNISFGMGQKNNKPNSSLLFEDDKWSFEPLKSLKSLAESQLGTVGGGNHYVDIFVDENDYVWVGTHFGSRGLGHKIAKHFLNLADAKDGIDAEPAFLDGNSQIGKDYLTCMEMAGRYAMAGRAWVCDFIAKNIIDAPIIDSVNNNHNFCWRENHFGQDMWVVRKGATPAFPQQRGFIGGSMGDNAYIVEGVDSELSKQALYSTVHGAGRVMSRTQAKGKFVKDENGRKIRQDGLVRHDDMMNWVKNKGVCLRGGDVDESPQAYRRLDEVLSYHAGTINILHTLRPIGVAMAGKNEFDPYKD